jgi:hypothetical protein
MPKPILASRMRRPSFAITDHPWLSRFGSSLATCDHCGAGIGRCIIDEQDNVWGFDCFARATGNPRIRRIEKEPSPSMRPHARRWADGKFGWRFTVPQLRDRPAYNMSDWERVQVAYQTREDIPASLIEALDEYSRRNYQRDCVTADKRNYPV